MIEQLRELFYEVVEDDTQIINEDTIIHKDLKINSLDLITLICNAEEKFDISISDKEVKSFVTVADVIKCIEDKTNK